MKSFGILLSLSSCLALIGTTKAQTDQCNVTATIQWQTNETRILDNHLPLTACILVNGNATFDWTASTTEHSVWLFPSEAEFDACNFTNAQMLAESSMGGTYVYSPADNNQAHNTTFYFGDNVGTNCLDGGVKVAIEAQSVVELQCPTDVILLGEEMTAVVNCIRQNEDTIAEGDTTPVQECVQMDTTACVDGGLLDSVQGCFVSLVQLVPHLTGMTCEEYLDLTNVEVASQLCDLNLAEVRIGLCSEGGDEYEEQGEYE